jgi:hypothetical protein
MRLFTIMIALLMMAGLLAGCTSFASNDEVHFDTRNGKTEFSDLVKRLSVIGGIAGLKEGENVFIRLAAHGLIYGDGTCTSPDKSESVHLLPGKDPTLNAELTSLQPILPKEIRKGRASFKVTTYQPTVPQTIDGAPKCLDSAWIQTLDTVVDVAFTDATVTIEQPPDHPVLTLACRFLEPTLMHGIIPDDHIQCTEIQK